MATPAFKVGILTILALSGGGFGEDGRKSTELPVFRSGSAWVWGENHSHPDDRNDWNLDPRHQVLLDNATSLAFGGSSGIAILADGSVRVWGDTPSPGLNEPQAVQAAPVEETHDAISIAAGYEHFLIAHSGGTVSAWGDNSRSQCLVPAGLDDVVAVAAGRWHSLALKKDGTVVAWGDNRLGQCNLPQNLTRVKLIRAGWFHSLVLLEDGTLRAWGFNHDRQTEIPQHLPPVSDIRAGAAHSLALLANGEIRVWGSDACGLVSTGNQLRGIKAIASGANHCIALDESGIRLWGQNGFGQTSRPRIQGKVAAVFAGENTTGIILTQAEAGQAPNPAP